MRRIMPKLALALSLATFAALGLTVNSASAGSHGRSVYFGKGPFSHYSQHQYYPGWGPRPPHRVNCYPVVRPNGQRTIRCY